MNDHLEPKNDPLRTLLREALCDATPIERFATDIVRTRRCVRTRGAAIAVLERNGVAGEIPVTGQDATDEGLQRVLLGTQCMTVYKAIKAEADAAAALAVGLTTLSACGLKGPLYLPGPESAPAATPSAPAASAPLPQPSTAP